MTTALLISLIACESSQISGFGYDDHSRTLAVQFRASGGKPGNVYRYRNVPAEVFAAFQASDSKGKFFGSQIKGKYEFEKQPDPETGIVFGLPQAQEPKYTTATVSGRLTNRATGKPIPDDEPVFILRAKDVNALHALRGYVLMLEDDAHITAVHQRIEAFEAFAAAHPERMKQPDTAPA